MKCLDTTVLIYAADTASPHHVRAVELLQQSVNGKWAACICDQSLWELAQLLTDSRFVRHPLAPAAAQKMLDRLVKHPQPVILYSDEIIVRHALKLMDKHALLRHRFAEAHLAATMLAHDVKTLVTATTQPFAVIRELDVENPFEALFA